MLPPAVGQSCISSRTKARSALRVISGRIRLELVDVTNDYRYPLTDKDKADAEGDVVRALAIGGLTPLSGNHQVRITCLEASTVFVLDSVTLTQSVAAYEWVPDMGPEALWHAAGAKLALEGGIQPDQYEGEWFDLSYVDAATEDEATIGGKVQVKDAETGIIPTAASRSSRTAPRRIRSQTNPES